jgi:16S rRNA processing protein RimM
LKSWNKDSVDREYLTIARVLKTQGREGEVAVEVHSDAPGRFAAGLRVAALHPDGSRRELQLEDLWPHKGGLVLKFFGIDSISDAETLLGCELQVPSAQRAPLEPGWTYLSDMVGCTVFDGSHKVGELKTVRFGAGEAPLLVVSAGLQEHEIPFAEAYLKRVDLAGKRIEMELPQGMLELSAPLTEEEKIAQHGSGRKKKASS